MRESPHCVYCGDWFQCRDHVIPVSWASVYRTFSKKDTVHCCAQCNTLAGSYAAFSVADKASYIRERYAKKFKRALRLPKWSREDLAGLTGGLKAKIEADQFLKTLIERKMENLELVSTGFPPVPIRQ